MLPRRLILALIVASLTPASCTRYVGVDSGVGPQAYYRTGFPVSDVSDALERVTASVVMILVQRTYVTYLFAEDNAPRTVQLQSPGSDVRVGHSLVKRNHRVDRRRDRFDAEEAHDPHHRSRNSFP